MNICKKILQTAEQYPNNPAFADQYTTITHGQLCAQAISGATAILQRVAPGANVGILCSRGVAQVQGLVATLFAGCCYVMLDDASPTGRLRSICDTAGITLILCDEANAATAATLAANPLQISAAIATPANSDLVHQVVQSTLPGTPAYLLFTSGSTGAPKGAVLTHRNVLSYQQWFCSCFNIGPNTRFGSQTALSFSMSVSDVYATLFSGGYMYLIPKTAFSFPLPLMDLLDAQRINTIYWVPSALGLWYAWKALDQRQPKYLQQVLFAGEALAVPVLNYYLQHMPHVQYANLYGPTETTDICTYYKVPGPLNGSSIPIGVACQGCQVMCVKDGKLCAPGEEGELYVKGEFVSPGYYREEQKTAAAFVQNPLHHNYPDPVYKTGDLAVQNKDGVYTFTGRADFMIKRAGYRIEPGEIESAAMQNPAVTAAAALYKDEQIVLFYCGSIKPDNLFAHLRSALPGYMVPNTCKKLPIMPVNANGKADRKLLMSKIGE